MRQVVEKLKTLIKDQFGLDSELELHARGLSAAKKSSPKTMGHFPIYDPQNKKIIGRFNVSGLSSAQPETIERIHDLVSVTLQSYIDVLNQSDASGDILRYLSVQLYPSKVIPIHEQNTDDNEFSSNAVDTFDDLDNADEEQSINRAILLFSQDSHNLQKLALQIHDSSKNRFFVNCSHMPSNFLSNEEGLHTLESTTIFIPHIERLSTCEAEVLNNFLRMSRGSMQKTVSIVCASNILLRQLVDQRHLRLLMKRLHYYHLFSQMDSSSANDLQQISSYADAIVGRGDIPLLSVDPEIKKVKSYSVIPIISTPPTMLH